MGAHADYAHFISHPLGAARVAHPVGERGRSRRGRTGPRDRLAFGASHPHIVAVAAVDVAAAAVTADAFLLRHTNLCFAFQSVTWCSEQQ